MLLPALFAASVPDPSFALQEVASGLTPDELREVATTIGSLERRLEVEDAAALGVLWSRDGVLSDWRGRRARGPEQVEADYRQAFRAYRRTAPFELADGREVRLQRRPATAVDHELVTRSLRPLGDSAAVVDGTWWTPEAIAPTGAPLSPEGARTGSGPPYHGAFRLVLDLGDGGAAVRALHLDPYDGSPRPTDASDAATVHFAAVFQNWAWGYRGEVCAVQPDGIVTRWKGGGGEGEEWIDRAATGELVSDTVGRVPRDAVARQVRRLGRGLEGELGPVVDGGSRDWGGVAYWAVRVDRDADSTDRWNLGEAGDNYRVHSSDRARAIARWIHAVLRDTPCTTRSPEPPVLRGGPRRDLPGAPD